MGVLCDPIFWVVCWLLIGSPTAVQLTQITQLNCVFEGEMATVCSVLETNADDRFYGGITSCFVRL